MLWMGNIQAHWTNAFVRSLFLVGGPEGVGGVEVSIRRNAFRVSPDTPSVGFALVTFATREAASEALARLQDTPVPGAEGHARFLLRKHAATLTTTTETPGTVRDGVSLRSQLAPLNVGELRRRLELGAVQPEREREVRASGGTARACGFCAGCAPRTARFQNLPNRAPRPRSSCRGPGDHDALSVPSPVPPHAARGRPRVSDRAAVDADGYISLSSLPGANARRRRRNAKYRRVWDAARALLASVAGEDAASLVDGLAVTKNVRGSPHVDALDVAAQFVASLGAFSSAEKEEKDALRGTGGFLCVEASPTRVVCVDTRDAIAAVDGRFVHWVDPAYEGERFSLVWYRRTGDPRAAEPPARARARALVGRAYWRDRAGATARRGRTPGRAPARRNDASGRMVINKKYGNSTFTAEGVSSGGNSVRSYYRSYVEVNSSTRTCRDRTL